MDNNKISIWIDTDTGVDDALALMCATSLPQLDIKGVSAVAGNVELNKTFVNARNVLSLCNREDIKVYPGADKPLYTDLVTASDVHGNNGLGGAVIPESKVSKETLNAYDAIYQCAINCKDKLNIVAIGPLTNIAKLILIHPDIKEYINEILIMGGAVVGGNATPCAEFNIYVDPDSAQLVLKSGIPIKMFGLDVTEKAFLNNEEINKISNGSNVKEKLFADSTAQYIQVNSQYEGFRKINLHDVCPIIYLVYPQYFTLYQAGVFVETQGKLTYGKTVCDLYSDFKFTDRHCQVAMEVDRENFVNKVMELLAK